MSHHTFQVSKAHSNVTNVYLLPTAVTSTYHYMPSYATCCVHRGPGVRKAREARNVVDWRPTHFLHRLDENPIHNDILIMRI